MIGTLLLVCLTDCLPLLDFLPCMVTGLSFYLAQKYAPDRIQTQKLLYEDELARALAEDGSASSTYITPKTYYPNI